MLTTWLLMRGAARWHAERSVCAKKFTGRYERRTIIGGIGHDLPQEAPQALAETIVNMAEG
jgi:hypothetical protein